MVAAETVSRIRQVADELGYAPSPQARWLHTGRSNAFTLVLPDITNPFFFDLIRGAQHEAARAGYTQVLVDTEESAEQEQAQLTASRRTSDGAVLGGSRLSDDQLTELAEVFPIVTVNRRIPGVPSVSIDTPTALESAVSHLAELGHQRLAYLGGPQTAWFDSRRWRAVKTAADDHQLHSHRLGHHQPTLRGGREAAAEIAVGDDTAVIAYNDLQALGLLRGLEELGIDVPGQISIVGCDNIFGADLTKPALTTISGSAEHVGELATQALLHRLDEADSPRTLHHWVPAALIIRDSTAPPLGTRRVVRS
jgi:DNA-binding LacI/PurR family transcriptional regulator